MYQKYVELKNKLGLTDYAVSKATGISTSTLTNWKYERYNPKLEKVGWINFEKPLDFCSYINYNKYS